MAGKSYNNELNEIEVSLAIERLLVADVGQAWSVARVDLASAPTGFRDLGAVVEDSPSLAMERSFFELNVGIPRVRQFQHVTDLNATFSIALHSNSWRKLQYALGNYTPSMSATEVSTVQSVTDRNTVTLASTSAAQSLFVNDHVVLAASSAELDHADAVEARISSIEDDNLTYHFDPTPIRTPSAGDLVAIYGVGYVDQFFGTSQITKYQLLGVADFVDGSQIVHRLPKVVPSANFEEAIRSDENGRIPLEFDAFGVTKSVQGTDELIVAERYYFPST